MKTPGKLPKKINPFEQTDIINHAVEQRHKFGRNIANAFFKLPIDDQIEIYNNLIGQHKSKEITELTFKDGDFKI